MCRAFAEIGLRAERGGAAEEDFRRGGFEKLPDNFRAGGRMLVGMVGIHGPEHSRNRPAAVFGHSRNLGSGCSPVAATHSARNVVLGENLEAAAVPALQVVLPDTHDAPAARPQRASDEAVTRAVANDFIAPEFRVLPRPRHIPQFVPMSVASFAGEKRVRSGSRACGIFSFPKLARRVATASGLKSTAARQLKPARIMPSVKPPQPQNRSMKVRGSARIVFRLFSTT